MGKRKNWRGFGSLAVSLLLSLALFLCGCGGGDAKENKGAESGKEASGEEDGEEYVYVAQYLPLNDYCEAISSVMLGNEQNVFFLGMKDEKDILFSLKIGEDSVQEFPLKVEEGMMVSSMGKDADGNLLIGFMGYEGDPEAGGTVKSVMVKKISPDGKELETLDTGNAFKKKDSMSFYLSDLLQDKEGNYYICSGKDIYVLNQDGSVYCEIPVGEYISNLFAMRDGRIVAAYRGSNGYSLEEVDLAGKGLKALDTSIVFEYGVFLGGTDTDLLYTQNSVLYSCNLSDEKPTALLNWIDSDINSNYLQDFAVFPDGRIVAVTVDYSSAGETELSVLTKKKRSEVPQKETLVYASWYVPYYVEKDIVAFNKRSEKYRIEVREYGDDSTALEEKITMMNTDLTSAAPPDIIDLSYCQLSLEELISAGIVEDITPYLEADGDIKREDYVENVMRAYERDGKLYAIMPCYGIDTMIGKVSDVGTGNKWTLDEMMALMDSKGPEVEILEYVNNNYMLHTMCTANQSLFVDEENGTCDFSGEEFKKILEFANRFPKEANYDENGPSEIEKLRNGQLLLLARAVTSVSMYQMYEYEFGEPVNFIGYPTMGSTGLILTPNSTTVAMHAASENKEGVWEFIRFNLTKDRQEKLGTANGGFPILKSALEQMFENDMEEEYYVDADGNKQRTSKSTWTTNDFTVEVYAATKEQVDRVREMIETAQPDLAINEKIYEIIKDEAQAYFDGQKSVEEVAGLVQNRVQTYLNETK